MDVSKIFMVNQDELMAQVAKLVDEAIEKRLATYDDDSFEKKVEDIIAQKGFSLINDDVDDAIGDFIRNQVAIDINC
jgi:hypothetical protein